MTTIQPGAKVEGSIRFRLPGFGGKFGAIDSDRFTLYSSASDAPPLAGDEFEHVAGAVFTPDHGLLLYIDPTLRPVSRQADLSEGVHEFLFQNFAVGTDTTFVDANLRRREVGWPINYRWTGAGAVQQVAQGRIGVLTRGITPLSLPTPTDVYIVGFTVLTTERAGGLVEPPSESEVVTLQEVSLLTKPRREDSDGFTQPDLPDLIEEAYDLQFRKPGELTEAQPITLDIAAYSYRSALGRPFDREVRLYPAEHALSGFMYGATPPNFYANAEIEIQGRRFVVSRMEAVRQEQHLVYAALDEI